MSKTVQQASGPPYAIEVFYFIKEITCIASDGNHVSTTVRDLSMRVLDLAA